MGRQNYGQLDALGSVLALALVLSARSPTPAQGGGSLRPVVLGLLLAKAAATAAMISTSSSAAAFLAFRLLTKSSAVPLNMYTASLAGADAGPARLAAVFGMSRCMFYGASALVQLALASSN